ncbi:hypothetical protein GF361_02275 [Candidatus Woesearchaeota archaeon]|nr:hypothetical protein [Candidatus Woesearchaeota archaeon]
MSRVKKRKNKEKISSFPSSQDIDIDKLKSLYYKLKDYIETIEKNSGEIPVSIFNNKLSSLESISKYAVENMQLSYAEISKIMNRSEKTIWQAYKNAVEKYPSRFKVLKFAVTIPLSKFSDRKLSVLEHIVEWLRENYDLKFSEIAKMIARDPRTVWTIYSRVKKKHETNK